MRVYIPLFLVAVQGLDFGAYEGGADKWFPAEPSPPQLMGGDDSEENYLVPQSHRRLDLPPYGPPIVLDPISDSRVVRGPYPARRFDEWIPTEFIPNLGYAYRLHDGLEYVITDKTTRPVIRRKRSKFVSSYTSYLHPFSAAAVDRHCYHPHVKSTDQLCVSLDAWRCLRAASFYRQTPKLIDIRETPSIWGFEATRIEPSTILAADGLRYGIALAAPTTQLPRWVLPRSTATLILREIDSRIEEVRVKSLRSPYSAYAVDLDDAAVITLAPLQYLRGVIRDSITETDSIHLRREISLAEAEGVRNVLMAVVDGVAQLPDLVEDLTRNVDLAEENPSNLLSASASNEEELTALAIIQTADGSLMTITPDKAQEVLSSLERSEDSRVQSIEEVAPPSPLPLAGEGLLEAPFTLLSTLLGRGGQSSGGNLMSIVPSFLSTLGGGQQAESSFNLAQIPSAALGLLGGVLNGGSGGIF